MYDIIPRDFIEVLIAKIDLIDIIHNRLPLKKKSGSNYFAPCPFHQEKSPSFSVSQTKQFYYCFGCGAHGNAIDFLMHYDRLSFPEAIETLARQVGMSLPQGSGASPATKKAGSHQELYELNAKVCAYYQTQLKQAPHAIEYLKGRGLSGEIARQFKLGYALQGSHHLLHLFGKTEADKKKLVAVGLLIKKEEGDYYDRFRDRITYPIQDYRGRIIGFGGRIIHQGDPKYLNSPETPLFQKGHELYGLYQVLTLHREIARIVIVEGYMDVLALFQHGITFAVATLGTATTENHLQRLFRFTSDIIFCFDGDEAGRVAAWRALQVLLPMMKDGFKASFLFLPEGEDPDSFIRGQGQNAFEVSLDKALSLSEFFFQRIEAQSESKTMEGRARYATHALNYIKLLPEGLLHGLLLDELAKRTRININDLKQQVTQKKTNFHPRPAQVKDNNISVPKPLKIALGLLLQEPKLAALIDPPLPNGEPHLFLIQLVEMIKKNPHITTGTLIEYYRGRTEEALIMELCKQAEIIPAKGTEQEFLGAIRQLWLIYFDKQINELMAKAAKASLTEDEKQALSSWINKKKGLFSSS